ncbi:MAG: hypothetical protein U9Q92_02120, partial [archaeon]|nr:hypothetical protein [archaeon]
MIRIDTTLPEITNCTSMPYMVDNDTRASIAIEVACIVNSTGSGVKSVRLATEQPYGAILNTTLMGTGLCTVPESLKYCAFFQLNSSIDIGKIYFHVNATNNLNNSNYMENATTSKIDDLSIIYNATTIHFTYYSFQDVEPEVSIYFVENNSQVNSGNATFELMNITGETLNTSETQISSGQANAIFYLGCVNETGIMYVNVSAEYNVLNEYNVSQQFNVSPLTTIADCWFDQIGGKIDVYCSYNDTVSGIYIGDAILFLNMSLGGSCDLVNALMEYDPSTQVYNYSCTPPPGPTYCSIPLNVTAQKACYNEANYSQDAATAIGFDIDAYFVPDTIHTMEHSVLWMNITSTDSDADGVNVSITQTGGPTIYGPWSIIENYYYLGFLIKDVSTIVTSDISVPSKEQTNNYSVDLRVVWNNTNCAGFTIVHPELKILDSYYVDFTNIILNKNKFGPKDILFINGTVENRGNVPVAGNLSATIINSVNRTKGILTCNVSSMAIPFDTSRDFRCSWDVAGQKRGITTGEYKVRLLFESPAVSLLYEEDIYIVVSEETPTDKNVYVTRYPITVIDRYGRTSQRIVKIYTWME